MQILFHPFLSEWSVQFSGTLLHPSLPHIHSVLMHNPRRLFSSIPLPPDAASEDAVESYLADLTANELPDLMYESKATLRNDFESFRQLFLLIGGLLCFIIGLVGILNFINAIMTSILSRQREFAILQSIGMTNRQLKQMLVYEGIFFTLGSGVAALLFTLVLNCFIWKMLEKMFWFFSSRQTLLPVLAALPVFALLGWLIPFLMCRQVTKYSIVERIRETE